MRAYLYVLCIFGATLMIAAEKPEDKKRKFNKNDCAQSRWTRKGQSGKNNKHGENFKNLHGCTVYNFSKQYRDFNKVGYEDQQNI